ncbi:uncharacterized protein EHS24_008284 [Apiotrichum porosum]|uniref:L-xylulose reductase n=1 Tax=Apiotrichum porosum TaxID=105984 RepID=A0A427XTB4_9TREE|nr:uncharacterized protein EHS24_008284 [Apiotrichum porosum]RSH82080.1 hypothetical protein EHS24_008284 [Apiotrichum porosum]
MNEPLSAIVIPPPLLIHIYAYSLSIMTVSGDLHGKIALVTGGGRGIGLAITRALAQAGATVIITYTAKDPTAVATAISQEFGVPVHVYYCPGEKSEVVNLVFEQASAEVGEVDLVIANAGVGLWRETIDMTDGRRQIVTQALTTPVELATLMHTNLFAPIYLARAAVRYWLGLPATVQGDISGIVNMSPQFQMAYNASKAGLTMASKVSMSYRLWLTRQSLAGEWAKYGITVNSVSPGYVKTDLIANPPPGEGAEWVAKWGAMTPVGRFADASEVGDMVAFMASGRASSFMTGHDIVMDGGYTTY